MNVISPKPSNEFQYFSVSRSLRIMLLDDLLIFV